MRALSPQAVAAKWQARVQASGDAYKAGIQAVQVNPAQQAIAAKDRWVAGIQQAAASGKWENALAKVQIQDWKGAATTKGVSNYLAGAPLGATKVQANEAHWGPIRAQIVSGLPARGSLQQNLMRAQQMALGMAQAAGRA